MPTTFWTWKANFREIGRKYSGRSIGIGKWLVGTSAYMPR